MVSNNNYNKEKYSIYREEYYSDCDNDAIMRHRHEKMPRPDCFWVMCSISIGFKTHAFTKITYKGGMFYPKNLGVFDIDDEREDIFYSILN